MENQAGDESHLLREFLFGHDPTDDDVKSHGPTAECNDAECLTCGKRDCPQHDPLHYHHDGCPSCWIELQRQVDNPDPYNALQSKNLVVTEPAKSH